MVRYQNTAYCTSIEPNRLTVWPPRKSTTFRSQWGGSATSVAPGGFCFCGSSLTVPFLLPCSTSRYSARHVRKLWHEIPAGRNRKKNTRPKAALGTILVGKHYRKWACGVRHDG